MPAVFFWKLLMNGRGETWYWWTFWNWSRIWPLGWNSSSTFSRIIENLLLRFSCHCRSAIAPSSSFHSTGAFLCTRKRELCMRSIINGGTRSTLRKPTPPIPVLWYNATYSCISNTLSWYIRVFDRLCHTLAAGIYRLMYTVNKSVTRGSPWNSNALGKLKRIVLRRGRRDRVTKV